MTISSVPGSVDPLDAALFDLLARGPSDVLLRRLDERVQRAIAAPRVQGTRRPQRIGRRPIALLAAAVLLIGAGAPLGLYDGLGASFDYGFSIQLARSVPVGATAIDDGVRVTIDRAYLDGERLMLAVRVTDERERPEISQLMASYSVVSDEDGVWSSVGSAGRPIGPWTATQIHWRLAPAPLPNGIHHLHVDIPHIFWRDTDAHVSDEDSPWHTLAGTWSFDLDLPVDGGATVVRPGTALDIDGARLTVDEVVFGASAIRVRLGYDDSATWTAVGTIRRGVEQYPFVVGTLGQPGRVAMQTDGGTDHPSGTWSLVIDSIDRQLGDAPEQRLEGPWKVDVVVP